MSVAWVRQVRQRYNTGGPATVPEGHQRHPGGRRMRLAPAQQQQLSRRLARPPQDGGVWTGAKVAAWMEARTGQKTYAQLGGVYLRRFGFSPQVPRRRHAQAASPAQQRAFKKSSVAK
jgi:transposase